MNIKLIQGDCIEHMREIPDASVDLVLCDPPYGITNCAWDTRLPLDSLWEQYRRICKPSAAIVIFSMCTFLV